MGLKCRECGRPGHKATVCFKQRSMPSNYGAYTSSRKTFDSSRNVKAVDESVDTGDVEDIPLHAIYSSGQSARDHVISSKRIKSVKQFVVALQVNGVPVHMDIDTCAEASIGSRELWEQLRRPRLRPAPRLRAYGGAEVPALGECDVDVDYKGRNLRLPLVFVNSSRERGLFGVPWISAFEAVTINAINSEERLSELLREFIDVFESSTGCIKGYTGHLYFKEGAQFKINKARPLPYAHRPLVEELSRLVKAGVLTPIDVAEFTTTPLVVVPKSNGGIRICGDFKVSVNPHLHVQQYPMPTCNEVFQKLVGGRRFTKLDLADAYLQLEMDEESRRYLVYTTHKGLYRVNRLAFGLACAPAVFQSVIEQVLAPVPKTQAYLDDIVVTGSTVEEHLDNLRQVLLRMRLAGIRLRRDKCRFFETQIEHLGRSGRARSTAKPRQSISDTSSTSPEGQAVARVMDLHGTVLLRFYSSIRHSRRAAQRVTKKRHEVRVDA